jgi:dienelactone hydrolase
MTNKRRDFLKISGLAFAGISIGNIKNINNSPKKYNIADTNLMDKSMSIIGKYGEWASQLRGNNLPKLSFRNKEFTNLKAWQKLAKKETLARMAVNNIGGLPKITITEKLEYDGLYIEKFTWQLPYGRPTEAILLKPANAKGKLPGILGFHDHSGNKYFGTHKIAKSSDKQHSQIVALQKLSYEGQSWANELAKKGYVVLVSDAFAFGSRRVMMQDIPDELRDGLTDNDPEKSENIDAYNIWADGHEQVMARSLFSAGTTWPGMFFAEDRKALDLLCNRNDVDSEQIGVCGLSGGGLRTVFMGGLDSRVKCAIPVGFMTTWNDFLLNKSYTHTWMTYVPLLPNALDFPEILGLRTPLPTLVLNNTHDHLFTLEEMKKAESILRDIYKKANAESHFACSFHDGDHKFDKKMQNEAFDWFDKWLKK